MGLSRTSFFEWRVFMKRNTLSWHANFLEEMTYRSNMTQFTCGTAIRNGFGYAKIRLVTGYYLREDKIGYELLERTARCSGNRDNPQYTYKY